MAKQTYVYSGTEWVPLASEVTNLTAYQTKALAQAPYRNLIINGAMQVAQRGTSTASITTDGYYTADRWNVNIGTLGTWTQSVENDAPTGSGFRKSLKMLATTADASPSASDLLLVRTTLEGQNLQQIKKGTASAEQLTASFWVKSNVTGTYIAELYDHDNTRSVSASYTINTSATWEKKTITFPADTTGALDNDNALSLQIGFWLGAGTTFTSGTLQTTWGTPTSANRVVGQVNLASATNNYWQITGVQLEVGDTATPFEFKPFAQDLLECQRYYQVIVSGNNIIFGGGFYYDSTEADMPTTFITEMRTAPTGSVVSGTDYYTTDIGSAADTFNTMTLQKANTSRGNFYSGTGTSSTAFRPCYFVSNNAASFIAVQAEL